MGKFSISERQILVAIVIWEFVKFACHCIW